MVLEMNEKLLEAHKKVVQSKLSREVARTILDGSSLSSGHHQQEMAGHSGGESHAGGPQPIRQQQGGGGSRRWGPHLEGIPEESRANTLRPPRAEDARAAEVTAQAVTEDEEERKRGGSGQEKQQPQSTTSSSSSSSQMKKLSTSDPQSLDSGILTRSSSISDISGSQTDIVTSNEFDTDNETVDVADSDDGESDDTDSDTYAAEGPASELGRDSRLDDGVETAAVASAFPQHEAFLRYQNRRQKKDFVSELYHTAVAKVPKVIPSDSESLYSSQSTMRRDFEYDSLDINSNARYKDIYTNPNIAAKRPRADNGMPPGAASQRTPPTTDRDDYEIVNVKSKENATRAAGCSRENVAEMYVNNEYDASTLNSTAEYDDEDEEEEEEEEDDDQPTHEYSAGEKMMISISGDNESVYSNKLLISVNGGHNSTRGGQQQPYHSPATRNFDPDTLERGTAAPAASGNRGYQAAPLERGSGASGRPVRREMSAPGAAAGQNKSSFYLFQDETTSDVNAGQRFLSRSVVIDSMQGVVVSSRPSLPPKTRPTPKLPPKPMQKGNIVPRPLPPPPPPFPR